MRKNIINSLGVFILLSCLNVKAAEKFEVLPDLPDPLAYAVQPAVGATVSGTTDVAALTTQSIGNEPSLISVVLSLLFVILLIYCTGIIYTKLNKINIKTLKKQQGDFARNQVNVISTTQLGNNKTLHIVELDGKRMLLGASSSAIQLIKDLGSTPENQEKEEFSHIEIPNIKIPKIEIPKIEIPAINFSKLMTKTHKPITDVFEDSKNEEVSDLASELMDKEEKEQVENPDVIIDSLFSPNDNKDDNNEALENVQNSEHTVDPDDFALYKKYLS